MLNIDKTPLRRAAAAQYIASKTGTPCASTTLARLACSGAGPKFQKVGAWPVYTIADLNEWIASKTSAKVTSTAELRQPRAA